MSDPLNIKKHIRNIKDFPIEGIEFRDITSLIETLKYFENVATLVRITKNFGADLVVSIESRGFILRYIASDLSLPFILARKS